MAQTVDTREKANNMVAWIVSTVENRVAPTVNVREKANNMLAWTVNTRENGVAPTVNTRERTVTTPAEEQILTMKNCPEEMQMLNPRDWQGGKMPRSSRGGGGGGSGWAQVELTDALLPQNHPKWNILSLYT